MALPSKNSQPWTGRLILAGCCLQLALFCANTAALQLYRYLDESGRTVISQHVPVDAVARGYDVISDRGKLIERIPPQRNAEELEKAVSEGEQLAAQRKYDKQLLLRYSAIGDIELAKERYLREFEQRIQILDNNLAELKRQVEGLQNKAAGYERKGQKIPEKLDKSIEDTLLEIESVQQRYATTSAEKDLAAKAYEKDLARFTELRAQMMGR